MAALDPVGHPARAGAARTGCPGRGLALPFLPLLANSFGWIFTEIGRQPWAVFGLMTTEHGVSPGVSTARSLTSLIAFTLLYGVLAVVEVRLLLHLHPPGRRRAAEPALRPTTPATPTSRSPSPTDREPIPMELTTVWFVLIAVLWIGYFFLEGFDFGVGMLLPVLAKDDTERRVLINTIGPVWDGNEVWLLVAGGATFAAFPEWYATLFSGFYLPLLLILLALIVRGLAFEYRAKRDDDRGARRWDLAIIVGSFVPALLWGVAFANILRGVPIDADKEYVGGFFNLLNPYALLGGLMTLLLFLTHGAMFVSLKTDGRIRADARVLAVRLGLAAAVVAVTFLVWTQVDDRHGGLGGRLRACAAPLWWPACSPSARGREGWAFLGTFVAIAIGVAGLFLALFPDVMPTSLPDGARLTTANAAATPYTLKIMTVVAVIFTPLVLAYQAWTYWVFRKRIAVHHIPARAPRPRRPMRPLDPRLRPHLAPARRELAGVLVAGVVGSVLVLAQAWVVTGLVLAALHDGDVAAAGAWWWPSWCCAAWWAGPATCSRRRRRPGSGRRCAGVSCWRPPRPPPGLPPGRSPRSSPVVSPRPSPT